MIQPLPTGPSGEFRIFSPPIHAVVTRQLTSNCLLKDLRLFFCGPGGEQLHCHFTVIEALPEFHLREVSLS